MQSCICLCSYADYQRRRLESFAARDSRLKFEVDTLLDRSGSSSTAQVMTNGIRVSEGTLGALVLEVLDTEL